MTSELEKAVYQNFILTVETAHYNINTSWDLMKTWLYNFMVVDDKEIQWLESLKEDLDSLFQDVHSDLKKYADVADTEPDDEMNIEIGKSLAKQEYYFKKRTEFWAEYKRVRELYFEHLSKKPKFSD